jgi:predicted dehydrogenase
MNKKYRWGILGAGKIADKFCTALDYVEGAEVYAVASRNMDNANAFAAKYNAAKCYDHYKDLMEDEAVDIIYIATPHAFHFEQAMACLLHKKNVLCEKPMTLSYHQTLALVNTAKENAVFLMEAMWTSCMPFLEEIQSLIKADVIGTPQYVAADFGFFTPFNVESRLFKKSLGGGSLMDVGVYPVFLATALLGEPSQLKTIAKLTSTGVDEYCNTVLQYENGATAHLVSSIIFNTAIEAEISGAKGRIIIQNPWFKATDFRLELNDGTIEKFSMPHQSNGFEHEIKEVMYCLDNGLLESSKMPHQLTLSISKIMEEILMQAGVKYE